MIFTILHCYINLSITVLLSILPMFTRVFCTHFYTRFLCAFLKITKMLSITLLLLLIKKTFLKKRVKRRVNFAATLVKLTRYVLAKQRAFQKLIRKKKQQGVFLSANKKVRKLTKKFAMRKTCTHDLAQFLKRKQTKFPLFLFYPVAQVAITNKQTENNIKKKEPLTSFFLFCSNFQFLVESFTFRNLRYTLFTIENFQNAHKNFKTAFSIWKPELFFLDSVQ